MIHRVRDRATFDAFRRHGRRVRRGPFTVVFVPAAAPSRVAFGIGRKVGPAVVRNRLRRRLRCVMHDMSRSGRLQAGAYLIVVRPAATGLDYAELVRLVGDACDEVSVQ